METLRFDNCPACGTNHSEAIFTPDATAWDRFRLRSQRKYQGYMDTLPENLSLEVRQCTKWRHILHHTQPDGRSIFGMYQAGVSLSGKSPDREPNTIMLL